MKKYLNWNLYYLWGYGEIREVVIVHWFDSAAMT